MATQGNHNNRVVWQDIRPAKKPVKPLPKRVLIKQKLKRAFQSVKNSPSLQKTIAKFTRLPQKTKLILGAICIGIILIGGYWIATHNPDNASKTMASSQAPGLVPGTPSFSVLVPVGKTTQSLGGYIRGDKRPLFVYIDKISDIQINVSQQPLPSDFASDVSQQVEQLAKSYKASGKITVGDTTVYIGSTVKGPQTVIFTKNNLLVLIVSSDKIENDQWAKYINSLQ